MISRLLQYSACFCFFLWVFAFTFRPLEISDVWTHLAIGRWIIEHQTVPQVDMFAMHTPPAAWMANEWLGSVLLYQVEQFFGLRGLQCLRVLVVIASLALFAAYAHRRMTLPLLLTVGICMTWALGLRSLLRPDMFSFIFLPLLLLCLLRHMENKDYRQLIPVPIIMALWTNIHPGSFIYGFSILAIVGTVTALQDRDQAKYVLITALIAMAASCINPYGVSAVTSIFKNIFIPSQSGLHQMKPFITEMQPPSLLWGYHGLWFFVLLAIAGAYIASSKHKRLLPVLLIGFGCILFLFAQRAGAFFAIVTGFSIAFLAPSVHVKINFQKYHAYVYMAVIVICLLMTAPLINRQVLQGNEVIGAFKLQYASPHPVDAIDALKTNGIKGNVFNTDTLGGYLLWSAYPGLKPFIDGRTVDVQKFLRYVHTMAFPDVYWSNLQKEFDLNIVMLNLDHTASAKFGQYIASHPDWQPVLLKHSTLVFVKRNTFHLTPALSGFEQELLTKAPSSEDIALFEGLKETQITQALPDIFGTRPRTASALKEALALYNMGYKTAGIKRIADVLRVNPAAVLNIKIKAK